MLCGDSWRIRAFRPPSPATDIWTRRDYPLCFASSHAVIVPTTSRFEEGFNMVCAEAILAGRPVITSAVCPALAYIREAAIEVQPDNIDQYYQAILQTLR